MNTGGTQAGTSRLSAYLRLMRFDRPIGILLLLWPTLWALWVAGQGRPSLKNLLIFCSGVVLMRAAGCVMNDFADRDFDPHVERTRDRPLASGEISAKHALVLFIGLLLLALLLVLQTNRLTIQLAFVGAVLAASYPFFKRVTHLPQLVLGLAFAWGMVMAFAAEQNRVPAVAWWLLSVNVVWSVIYDTYYAMVDREDDLKIGVKSTAILFAGHDLRIIAGLKLVMLALLIWIGVVWSFSWPYFVAVAGVAVLFVVQQRWARQRKPALYFKAFLNNNWVGFVLFMGFVGHYLLVN